MQIIGHCYYSHDCHCYCRKTRQIEGAFDRKKSSKHESRRYVNTSHVAFPQHQPFSTMDHQTPGMPGLGQGARQRTRAYSDVHYAAEDESESRLFAQSKKKGGKRNRKRRKGKETNIWDNSTGAAQQGAYVSKFTEAFGESEQSEECYNNGLDEMKDSSPTTASPTPGHVSASSSPTGILTFPEFQEDDIRDAASTSPHSTYAGIVKDGHEKDKHVPTADLPHRFTGPAPPPLRGFPNFPQSNSSRQNLQLGSGRLQNSNKLGAL